MDYKDMSEEKLDEAMEEKYGPNWNQYTVDGDDPMVQEYFDRISRGM